MYKYMCNHTCWCTHTMKIYVKAHWGTVPLPTSIPLSFFLYLCMYVCERREHGRMKSRSNVIGEFRVLKVNFIHASRKRMVILFYCCVIPAGWLAKVTKDQDTQNGKFVATLVLCLCSMCQPLIQQHGNVHMHINKYTCRYKYTCIYVHIYTYIHSPLRRRVYVCRISQCRYVPNIKRYMYNVYDTPYTPTYIACYGLATISRLLKIIGLFCRISSLL